MSTIKKFGLLVCSSILLGSMLSGCGDANEVAAPTKQDQTIYMSVETEKVKATAIEAYKVIASSVYANHEISVIPKASGIVTKLNVSVGDEVKAGDVLYEIDATDLNVQVDSARAAVAAAEATVNTAQAGVNAALASQSLNTGSTFDTQITSQKSNITNLELNYNDLLDKLEGYEALYEAGALAKTELDGLKLQIETAKNQLDLAKETLAILEGQTISETKKVSAASVEQAKANLEQAKAAVTQSKANLQSALNQLSYTQVKAEANGIISSCLLAKGAMVSAQSAALTIVDIDQVKIQFSVTDDMINKVHIGDKVYITIDSISNESFEGTISSIAPAANSQTLLYPIEINIKNADHKIKPGMFATSKLVLERKENVISVPLNAVIEKAEEKYVYIIDSQQIAHKVAVQTGIENDTHIEIISGLNSGDEVVTRGQDYLKDGSTVNVVTAEAKAEAN